MPFRSWRGRAKVEERVSERLSGLQTAPQNGCSHPEFSDQQSTPMMSMPKTPNFGTHAGMEEVSMPVVFGPFSKVWDDLGSFDMKLSSFRHGSSQASECSTTSTADDEVESLCSEADDTIGEAREDTECQSPCHHRASRSLSTPLTKGRFSEVWFQFDHLDAGLVPARGSSAGLVPLRRSSSKVEQQQAQASGSIRVLNIAGNVVGDFKISPGMTVSTLKDRIATQRGDLPVTMTLLRDAEILDDAQDLSAIARRNAADSIPITLLHAAPSIGSGSFSKVWDDFAHLDAQLGSFGSSLRI